MARNSPVSTVTVRSRTPQLITYGGSTVGSVELNGDYLIVNRRVGGAFRDFPVPMSRVVGYAEGESGSAGAWATVIDFYERTYVGETDLSGDSVTVTPTNGLPATFLLNDAHFVIEVVSGSPAQAAAPSRPRTSRGDVPVRAERSRGTVASSKAAKQRLRPSRESVTGRTPSRDPAQSQAPKRGKKLTVREQRALRKAQREAEAGKSGRGSKPVRGSARSQAKPARSAKPAAKPARETGKPSKRKPAVW